MWCTPENPLEVPPRSLDLHRSEASMENPHWQMGSMCSRPGVPPCEHRVNPHRQMIYSHPQSHDCDLYSQPHKPGCSVQKPRWTFPLYRFASNQKELVNFSTSSSVSKLVR